MNDTPTEATTVPSVTERRAGTRTRVTRLILIKLGDENGGIASDISEEGLGLVAALPLVDTDLRSIRIQVPGSSDRIEAHGTIVWKSESKLRAGVQFTGLEDQVRQQIQTWIALEASSALAIPIDSPTAPEEAEEKGAEGEQDTRPVEDSILGGASNPVQAPEDSLQAAPAPYQWNRHTLQPPTEARHHKEARSLAPLILLVAILSFGIGWLTSSPTARTWLSRLAEGESASTRSVDVSTASMPPKNSTGSNAEDALARQLPAEKDQERPENQLSTDERSGNDTGIPESASPNPAHEQSAASGSKTPRESNNQGGMADEGPSTTGPTSKTGLADHPKANVPRQEKPNDLRLAQPRAEAGKLPQPNSASAPSSAPSPPNHDEEASPQQAREQAPEDVRDSVVVVADPYPSIRLPLEPNSRKSPTGEHLQLGRLISRVDPVYPTDAKQHGIEGAVTLRALIGRDGLVQDVVSVNGPALLIPATLNAIRQWKYSATLVAGQPVETEESISVNFQLSK